MNNIYDENGKLSKRILFKSFGTVFEELYKLAEVCKEHEENEVELEITAKKLVDTLRELSDKLEVEAELKKVLTVDRSLFPKAGELLAEGNKVRLNVIKSGEEDNYLSVVQQYSFFTKGFEDEAFRKMVWDDLLEEYSFVCSIFERQTNNYVGYCKIEDLSKEEWEVVIELNSMECHKGYGTEALTLFMQEIHKLTGNRYFKARIEDDNYVAQGFIKKLGGMPDGVSEDLLRGEVLKDFQANHKDEITDEIKAVAEEFNVKAEEMIGCRLDYKFDMDAFMK